MIEFSLSVVRGYTEGGDSVEQTLSLWCLKTYMYLRRQKLLRFLSLKSTATKCIIIHSEEYPLEAEDEEICFQWQEGESSVNKDLRVTAQVVNKEFSKHHISR